jgi:hypothetical protein
MTAPLPDDVQAFADVHEDGQLRLGVAGDQLAALPLPTPPERRDDADEEA